jgi:glycosyltransferase involved in cell wall biosynthesis
MEGKREEAQRLAGTGPAMHVLVLADAFWPEHTGGVSKSLLTEIQGLHERGHRITVVTRRLVPGSPRHESTPTYELYRYPGPPRGSRLERLFFLSSLLHVGRVVGRIEGADGPEVAYVHHLFQAAALARRGHPPYVYAYHAPLALEVAFEAQRGKYGRLGGLARLARGWILRVERRALEGASVVVVRSRFMAGLLDELHGPRFAEKVVRIGLGVDTERFAYCEDPARLRPRLGLPEAGPVLLTVRRLVARMGLENLLLAMKDVARRFPRCLLLVAGRGYLESRLRQMVRELELEQNVRFLGFVEEERLPLLYQAADLFVMPTAALEGFGLSTLEALSCGTPVVATPVGANPEVVAPLGEAFLCRDATPEALAERICALLSAGGLRALRPRCRAHCEATYERGKVAGEVERILRRVAGRPSC